MWVSGLKKCGQIMARWLPHLQGVAVTFIGDQLKEFGEPALPGVCWRVGDALAAVHPPGQSGSQNEPNHSGQRLQFANITIF